MDFVDLANDMSAVTQSLLRHLTTAEEGDDDFARLDGEYHSSSAHQMAAAPAQQVQGSNAYYEDPTVPLKQPFLSPTAEAELYLLATNFLLCKKQEVSSFVATFASLPDPFIFQTLSPQLTDVAMVIIITMIAKIYFPESLERGVAVPQARTFNYRMAENDDYYASDADDPEESSDAKTDDDDDDDNEILASDEDEADEEEAPVTEESETNDLLSEMRPSQVPISGLRPGVSYDSSSRILEFEQLTMSKSQVLRRLIICIVMLNVTFVTWGVLQVRQLRRICFSPCF